MDHNSVTKYEVKRGPRPPVRKSLGVQSNAKFENVYGRKTAAKYSRIQIMEERMASQPEERENLNENLKKI